jgi:hypothetical protein
MTNDILRYQPPAKQRSTVPLLTQAACASSTAL